MVRTVCKAVQDRDCEKSGKPVEFREFLQTQGQVKDVPLASFKGNIFNILFHNSAGVDYLLRDLLSFAEEHNSLTWPSFSKNLYMGPVTVFDS
jgi:hypothetical protein